MNLERSRFYIYNRSQHVCGHCSLTIHKLEARERVAHDIAARYTSTLFEKKEKRREEEECRILLYALNDSKWRDEGWRVGKGHWRFERGGLARNLSIEVNCHL